MGVKLQLTQFKGHIFLLDGGLGKELRFRGVAVPETIWSAGALMTDPEVVRQIHLDYIAAGADIITTNTYGVIRQDLAKEGIEDRYAELNHLACKLAMQAREMSGREVVIAGSLPPLRGSYRPDLVGPSEEIQALYMRAGRTAGLLCGPAAVRNHVQRRRRTCRRKGCLFDRQTRLGGMDAARRPVRQVEKWGNDRAGHRCLEGPARQRLPGELLRPGKHHHGNAPIESIKSRMDWWICQYLCPHPGRLEP